MPPVTVIARLLAKPESADVVKRELHKLIAPTREEAGCIEYRLHQDNANPAIFIFYENWADGDCLEKHKQTDHYLSCFGTIEGLIMDKAVNKLTMVEQ